MSSTYSDVDASPDPAFAVASQEQIDQWPHVRAYKDQIRRLLGGTGRVLDVGCGPGGDIVALGSDRCRGVDRSMAMCRAAAARGARACQADVHQLPFPDRVWEGVVADRVLQHVEDPVRALSEMVRILRPNGRVVVADPDQETLVIHVPGVRPELTDRVRTLRRDVGYRNGRLISSVPTRLRALGLVDVSVAAFPLVLTDPDDAFGLPQWPHLWQNVAGFTADELVHWEEGMARCQNGGFLYALLYFVVSGVKP